MKTMEIFLVITVLGLIIVGIGIVGMRLTAYERNEELIETYHRKENDGHVSIGNSYPEQTTGSKHILILDSASRKTVTSNY